MPNKSNPSLDATEIHLVDQSKTADSLSGRELTLLVRQLRERRERVKRAMAERARAARRDGKPLADTGAQAKKAELVAAIDRVSGVLEARNPANWLGEAVRGPTKAAPKPTASSKSKPSVKKAVSEKQAGEKPKAEAKSKPEPKTQADTKPKPKAKSAE